MTQLDFAMAYVAVQSARTMPLQPSHVQRDFKAGSAALERMRQGMSRGLAVFKSAEEYGLTPKYLGRYLSGRRRSKQPVPRSRGEYWWDK